MTFNRTTFAAAILALLAALPMAPAVAQSWPSRPLTIVSGYAAGGAADIVIRAFALKLGRQVGQSVIVENRAGAAQTIAAAYVARSAPDGYTLYVPLLPNQVSTVGMYPNLSYDVIKSFSPISTVAGGGALIMVVNSELPARNMQEYVQLARSQPGKISYGTTGIGAISHLAGELLSAEQNVSLLHVPFKGAAAAITATIAGDVKSAIMNFSVIPHVKDGKLRALAITAPTRVPQLPDLPTMIEQGFKDFVVEVGFILLAPAGTPQPVVDRLNAATRAVVADAELQQIYGRVGFRPTASSPQELVTTMERNRAVYVPLIQKLGLKPDQ